MMTVRQNETLEFIKGYIASTGVSPTFQEIATAVNLRSKSGVHRLVAGLEERGLIRRRHYRERAIELMPDDAATPNMIDAGRKALDDFRMDEILSRPENVVAHVYACMRRAVR